MTCILSLSRPWGCIRVHGLVLRGAVPGGFQRSGVGVFMRRVRRLAFRLGMVVVAFAVLVGVFLRFEIMGGNMHEVVPGQLYRSAQLDPDDLAYYVERNHIATVLNLRGPNPNADWYKDEIAESAKLGVKHIDFAMKASRELTDDQAKQLIEVMRDAPKPLLIHCHSGADRTGLAAALYVAAIVKGTEWEAERQMWLNYGHIAMIGAAVAMNRTFERLEPMLGYAGS